MSHPPLDPARPSLSRRTALGVAGLSLAGLAGAALPRWARALGCGPEHGHCANGDVGGGGRAATVEHPAPRPGVTGERVLPADQVRAKSRAVYAKAREIPEILDGIYCHCDCARRHDLRSLLQCFESKMAAGCGICSGQATLAYRLHGEGESLDAIRAAIDERYGE